jgi:hypothetical protein
MIMPIESDRKNYLAFMLRIWSADQGETEMESVWRASLESSQSHEHFTFTDLGELFVFLEQELSEHERSHSCRPKRNGDP